MITHEELSIKFKLLENYDNLEQLISIDEVTFIYRNINELGVAILVDQDLVIFEKSSNIQFYTKKLNLVNYLILSSHGATPWNHFAMICSNFLDKGDKNKRREIIKVQPLSWWNEWISLLGNVQVSKKIYDILGEMVCFKILLENGIEALWSGIESSSSHDISSVPCDYEVKSTITKYKTEITISSQYQLSNFDKELKLLFCRFEKSPIGISISSVYDELVQIGIAPCTLDASLKKYDLYKGSSLFNETYTILEILEFKINENFPKITNESFKNNKIPINIVHLQYSIDLAGLEFSLLQ